MKCTKHTRTHVRRICAMNVYTVLPVRRKPVRRTCTAHAVQYIHSANTALLFAYVRLRNTST